MLAPICLFTYSRLAETQQTVEALQKNYLATESDLIIFSDGPKNELALKKVHIVRDYLKTITGFKSVKIIQSLVNKGLANSIISGVTKVLHDYGKVIVLEDDLVTTPNFLSYMNQCLDLYETDNRIISVCGYGLKINKPKSYEGDTYLYSRSSSWGWGTWKNQWETVDWDVKDWANFKKDEKAKKAFNKAGSDMFSMLKTVTEGNGHSWAIRFCYAQFKQAKFSVMPFNSLVDNNGFGVDGTNTHFKYSRFKTNMDAGSKKVFDLKTDLQPNKSIEKACYAYHSIFIRIYSRIRYMLGI